ncbi:hypothetical protein C1I95_02780 [Micromonospora craterilacus]|uniref:Uncharacterized protein n=1 Tax=Micromonospora craterilacus TaxID=1655439 RepID=A0A2W2FEE4_9ACTN|nr:hypothetical protein [Micromonospora craterilacus]PZG23820.1 hypothetical protein C1I95_02780 [Micromonospora craterilacus]
MLDDMRVLRDVVRKYRVAATAAGVDWPDQAESSAGQPPDLVYRIFGVDHVAEQLTWLQSQRWPDRRLLPNAGWRMPWPEGGDALDALGLSIGTPFLWRQQLPLFHFDVVLYTFVLAGEHEGEIWRYEISPDAWDSVRAAPSLAALFDQWTKGIDAGVVVYDDHNRWLLVEDVDGVPGLDPLAFPVAPVEETLLRARQRECGVNMAIVEEGFEYNEELLEAIDAAKASLGV